MSLAGGQDHFQPQDVVPGDAPLHRHRAAGAFGDVAADGAELGAGRVRRVVEALGLHLPFQPAQDDAGLHHRHQVVPIDFENAVQPGQDQHHPALDGHGPAAAAGPRPPGRDGKAVLIGQS